MAQPSQYSRRTALRRLLAAALTARLALAAAAHGRADTTAVLPEDALDALARSAGAGTTDARVETVSDMPFRAALRLRTIGTPTPYAEGEYAATVSVAITAPVTRGDVLEATFTVRADGPPGTSALTRFVFERTSAPNTKSASEPIVLDTNWQPYLFRFRADDTYGPGEAHAAFYLGYGPQTFLIGDLSVVNDGPGTAVSLPPYVRSDLVAPWQENAAARIETMRKGNLTITVENGAGNRIADARVHVAMQRHAFAFGSAVTGARLLANDAESKTYRETIGRLYNWAVFENDMKWREWESGSPAAAGLNVLHDLGITVRGHSLIWPRWQYVPDDLFNLRDDPHAVRARVDTHIADEVSAFAGRLAEWDVLNEPYTNHDVIDVLGTDEMARWFTLAARADPTPRLYLNDADFFEEYGLFHRKQRYYANLIPALLAAGAPLGGIGMQSHFATQLPPISRVLGALDRFGAFGLPIQITELDINTKDEQLQADFLRDFMTAAFSHRAVAGIILWGFWEREHWRPDAALYRKDWSAKPNGEVWEDLVTQQWWTNTVVRTDGTGQATVRGFFGDYLVAATADGMRAIVPITLAPPRDARVTISLRPET